MKKTILSVLFLSLSASMMAVHAENDPADFKAELDSQKDLITDNKFYPANNVFYTETGVFVPTFKQQLDRQKTALKDFKFYPAMAVMYKDTSGAKAQLIEEDVYYVNEGIFVPSFKEQLDSQKEAHRDFKFYPATAVFYHDASSALTATFKSQLNSQKELLKDYIFYPSTNVFYTNHGVMLPSFKEQLDSQKDMIKDYTFYPANNVYYTEQGVYAPTFKKQLDSQKDMIKDYKF